ncbi:MAG: response regulator transcription factor [Candidatus Binatia bacterium]
MHSESPGHSGCSGLPQKPGSPYLAKKIDLSGQQERALSHVAKGITNKEIAVELGLSEKTVRNYLTAIFQKLHITHRTEAAVYFTQKFPLDPGR